MWKDVDKLRVDVFLVVGRLGQVKTAIRCNIIS